MFFDASATYVTYSKTLINPSFWINDIRQIFCYIKVNPKPVLRMYVQNEIVVKWIYMVSYLVQFSYSDCNLIFDNFLFLEIIQHILFWISLFPVLQIKYKAEVSWTECVCKASTQRLDFVTKSLAGACYLEEKDEDKDIVIWLGLRILLFSVCAVLLHLRILHHSGYGVYTTRKIEHNGVSTFICRGCMTVCF